VEEKKVRSRRFSVFFILTSSLLFPSGWRLSAHRSVGLDVFHLVVIPSHPSGRAKRLGHRERHLGLRLDNLGPSLATAARPFHFSASDGTARPAPSDSSGHMPAVDRFCWPAVPAPLAVRATRSRPTSRRRCRVEDLGTRRAPRRVRGPSTFSKSLSGDSSARPL